MALLICVRTPFVRRTSPFLDARAPDYSAATALYTLTPYVNCASLETYFCTSLVHNTPV